MKAITIYLCFWQLAFKIIRNSNAQMLSVLLSFILLWRYNKIWRSQITQHLGYSLMLGLKPNASEGALLRYALSCVTQKKKSRIKGIVRWTASTSACTTCPRDLCCNNEPSTAPPFTAFVCSKDSFLLHTRPDVSSELLVLSRIILTSCHSSIHTLANSQTVHALHYIPEEPIHTQTPCERPCGPFPGLPEATEHAVFFTTLHVHRSFRRSHLHNILTPNPFFLTVSQTDTAGAALMLSPAKMTCIEVP